MISKKLMWLLVRHHFGAEYAATSRELEIALGATGRQIRSAVHTLRRAGLPICSGDNGYFYASTPQELEHSIAQMSSRIECITKARSGLLHAYSQYSDPLQTTLEEKTDKESNDYD